MSFVPDSVIHIFILFKMDEDDDWMNQEVTPLVPPILTQMSLVSIRESGLDIVNGLHQSNLLRADDQRNYIIKNKAQFERFNHQNRFSEPRYLPVDNFSTENSFSVTIVGINGKSKKVNAIFDTGCIADGVIGKDCAKELLITENKFGVSFIYIIEIDGHEFVCHSLTDPSTNSKTSYTKDCYGGHVSNTLGTSDKEHYVDLLIGYRTMKQLAEYCNIFVSADVPLSINNTLIHFPFTNSNGLCTILGESLKFKTFIDTGCYLECDLIFSNEFVRKNKINLEKIDRKLVISYGDHFVVIENCQITVTYREILLGVDCMAGVHLMKKLLQNNVIVTIL